MSLDKAIRSGKEHRKEYKGSKRIACSCRNHGSCDYCKGNRLYQTTKEKQKAEHKLREERDRLASQRVLREMAAAMFEEEFGEPTDPDDLIILT